jgi:RNA polymerase sigma-70 factor (ECF subfamily)
VQQVFYKLWEKKEQIEVQQSIKSYLYRSVHNESINYLRHEKVRSKYQNHLVHTSKDEDRIMDNVALKELQQKIDKALNELPEQCRTIFQLSRYEELNYREIATTLGISVSTVKNQVGKALRVLRTKLSDFLPTIIFLLATLKN